MLRFLLAPVLIAGFASTSLSQATVAYDIRGDGAQDAFGWSLGLVGDVDGDRVPDYIVGAPNDDDIAVNAGSATIRSGIDGTILLRFDGDSAGDLLGSVVSAAGDVNGDGVSDIILGVDRDDPHGNISGSARVCSGVDGSTLLVIHGAAAGDQLGSSACGIGDVNGDGFADLLVGAIGADIGDGSDSGAARIYSGLDGSVLHSFFGDNPNAQFGISVSGIGDVDDDGIPDIVIGSAGDMTNGFGAGLARVFSGADGSIIFTFLGDNVGDALGYPVSGVGDVDGDGIGDIIVGIRFDDDHGVNSGSARVYSGADGSVIRAFHGIAAGDQFGAAACGAGDVNGDGHADLVVGARYEDTSRVDAGRARVYSGKDGAILFVLDGDSTNDHFGWAVSGAGDVDGDGFCDVVVGIPGDDDAGGNAGSVRMFLSPTLPVMKFRTTSTCPHLLDLDWMPNAADPYALSGSLNCEGATPGGIGYCVVSTKSLDRVYYGFLPGLIDFDPASILSVHGFGFDLTGSILVPGVSRQEPSLAGSRVHLQFFEFVPFLTSSPALRMEVSP